MKAEKVAMQHCCAKCVHNKLGCSMKVLHNGRDCIKCGNYIKGYHQAEKDNELTVDDIKNIDRLLNQCVDYGNPYQEVLKRLKERKEKWHQTTLTFIRLMFANKTLNIVDNLVTLHK